MLKIRKGYQYLIPELIGMKHLVESDPALQGTVDTAPNPNPPVAPGEAGPVSDSQAAAKEVEKAEEPLMTADTAETPQNPQA